MLENIYATKMSVDRKQLQKRFSKIRSQNNKMSRLMAIFISVVVLITIGCDTIVMATVGGMAWNFGIRTRHIYSVV